MLSQNFKKVLKLIHAKLKNRKIQWAVIGTTNLALQGIKIKPADLDIITDIKSLRKIEKLLSDYMVEPLKKRLSFVKNEPDFYELNLKVKDVEVHIIGEEKTGLYLSNIKDTVLIELENIKVPCLSLKSGIEAYSKMKREDKVKLIKEFLKES